MRSDIGRDKLVREWRRGRRSGGSVTERVEKGDRERAKREKL